MGGLGNCSAKDMLSHLSMSDPRTRTVSRSPRLLWWLFLASFLCLCCWASPSSQGNILVDELFEHVAGDAFDTQSLDHGSSLVTRQSNASSFLEDNSFVSTTVTPGTSQFWTFRLNSTATTTLYITIGACTQPFPKPGLNATEIYSKDPLPSLQLYSSTDASNTQPGPSSPSGAQVNGLIQGFVNVTLENITSSVFFTVVAPSISSNYEGTWSYQLGSSTKGD
jgi:Stretch-activated Ca2+-permeable channel component